MECRDENGMEPWDLMSLQSHSHLSLKGLGDCGSPQEQKEANSTPVFKKHRKATQDREFPGKLMEQLILGISLEHTSSSLNFSEGT